MFRGKSAYDWEDWGGGGGGGRGVISGTLRYSYKTN